MFGDHNTPGSGLFRLFFGSSDDASEGDLRLLRGRGRAGPRRDGRGARRPLPIALPTASESQAFWEALELASLAA